MKDKKIILVVVLFIIFAAASLAEIVKLSVQNQKYARLIQNIKQIEQPYKTIRVKNVERKDEPEQYLRNKDQFIWPDKRKAAISLSYDDGLTSHFEYVAPLLSKHHLKATFYPKGYNSLIEHADKWTKVAEMGHELGNHSLFHPCRKPNVNPAYHLSNYNSRRWTEEMKTANYLLKSIDGRSERTFAYPCAQTTIGPIEHAISVSPLLDGLFLAARTYARGDIIIPENLNLFLLQAYATDLTLKTFQHMLAKIQQAEKQSGWVIFVFHEIDDGRNELSVDKKEHLKLISYLSHHSDTLWTAPIIEVCKYLQTGHAE